jgi:ankyrin repeat protein
MISEAMQALYAGERERAESLLTPGGETVFEAAAFGRLERLAELLEAEPELVNAYSSDGFTPLHLACFSGGAETARLLVERGADLEAISRASFARVRPLGTAAFSGDRESARVLLEAGADPHGTEPVESSE